MIEKVPKAFIEEVYDDFFDETQKLFDEYPVCGDFEFGICKARLNSMDGDTAYRVEKEIEQGLRHSVCCCENCKHLRKKGCTTRNLKCKLFLCYYQEKNNKELYKKLSDIRARVSVLGFSLGYFISKEENLEASYHEINTHQEFINRWFKVNTAKNHRLSEWPILQMIKKQ